MSHNPRFNAGFLKPDTSTNSWQASRQVQGTGIFLPHPDLSWRPLPPNDRTMFSLEDVASTLGALWCGALLEIGVGVVPAHQPACLCLPLI